MGGIQSIPAPGIPSLNGVRGNGLNLDITSSDASVVITPNQLTRSVDLTVSVNSSTLIRDVPCDASVAIGKFVRMDSGTAVNAIADSLVNSNVIGVVEAKASSTLCDIRFLGLTTAIFAGLDTDTNYFLSDTVAGDLTTTAPITSGHVVLSVGKPFNATQFVVIPGVGLVRS